MLRDITSCVTGIDNEIDLQKDCLPFDDWSFHTVICAEVIEHIMDCNHLLREIKRVLRKDGKLIITTPNLASLGRRLMLLFGNSPYVENFLYPTDAGHVKHFTFKDFKYLLQKNDFMIKKMLSDVVIFPYNIYSTQLARWFPRLGRSIIAVCKPIKY